MSASPFIGPFMSTVQKWEKCLTLISEIVDEWIVVQRKWLYLEGIFIGGDIREQLPEEAKKFDEIDKNFRKVRILFIFYFFCIIVMTPKISLKI
jgi:dynein heavy chain